MPTNLQRKPFWAPVGIAGGAALAAALVIAVLTWLLVTARSTTVIVVRDAEAASDGGSAVGALSPAGRSRAELLARMFGDTRLRDHVDDIYVSPTLATQATALPLGGKLGIKPVVIAQQTPHAWARRVLADHRGGRILVVTEANMARDLAAELSGVSDIPSILPTEFGTMYIVTVPRIGRATLLSVAY